MSVKLKTAAVLQTAPRFVMAHVRKRLGRGFPSLTALLIIYVTLLRLSYEKQDFSKLLKTKLFILLLITKMS